MILTLHGSSILDAIWEDQDTGEPVYSTDTPHRWVKRVTTLSRISPDTAGAPLILGGDVGDSDATGLLRDAEGLRREGDALATINWTCIGGSIEWESQTVGVYELLHRAGPLKGSFSFTAPDGVVYKWDLGVFGSSQPVLTRNDHSDKVLARYNSGDLLHFRNSRLEVDPSGESILDLIIVTLVYVEKTRRERWRDIQMISF